VAKTDMKSCATAKCDMAKMATMTKDECAAMCEEKGCNAEEKAECMSHYDATGKFIASHEKMISIEKKLEKTLRIEVTNTNGKSKATVTTDAGVQTFEGTEAEVKAKIDALK
jgi:K(+)-stimulated pyrophosphate-energized sodium pump